MGLDATFYRHLQPIIHDSEVDSYLKQCGVLAPAAVVEITESVWDFRKFNGLERFMKTHKLHRQRLDGHWLGLISTWADRVLDKADELEVDEYARWSVDNNPLRPMAGFFFGSTDYTSVYFNHLQKLINVCNLMRKDIDDGTALYYTYESSW